MVSNLGRVRSLFGGLNSDGTRRRGRILKLSGIYGYVRVGLYCDFQMNLKLVHRLVLLAFRGPSPLDVNHKNGIKNDNRLKNLEYCTKSMNIRHAVRTGLMVAHQGEFQTGAKLTLTEVQHIRRSEKRQIDLAKQFKVSPTQICNIKNGKSWKWAK